jgi:RNA polymerase-binding protein DksA
MDKRTRQKFKKLLLGEREKITGQIMRLSEGTLSSSQRESSGDLSGYALHMADVGSDTFQRDLDLGLVSNEQEILYKIDEALRMIEDGTYGKCQNCGKRIKESRLRAVPFARLCVACQEKEEAVGKS